MIRSTSAIRKLFRVADLALVVYDGREIQAVKHSPLSAWLIWNSVDLCWTKALREQARDFELLPLDGHLAN